MGHNKQAQFVPTPDQEDYAALLNARTIVVIRLRGNKYRVTPLSNEEVAELHENVLSLAERMTSIANALGFAEANAKYLEETSILDQ